MLQAFKRFLSDLAVGEKDQAGFQDSDYRLAAAALLIHAAMIDGANVGHRAQQAASASSCCGSVSTKRRRTIW